MSGIHIRCLSLALAAGLAGCATKPFVPLPVSGSDFVARGITQNAGDLVVTAAVPTAAEFEDLTGVDVYEDGIQPVWLSIENGLDLPVRITHSSIDPNYYSPLEVAWKYRGNFSEDGATQFDKWFHDHRLPRGIPPGSRFAGFVYTHAVEGTKGFNVDTYWEGGTAHFTFFVPIPGFVPDYMDVDYKTLYVDEQLVRVDDESLRGAVEALPERSSDATGLDLGDPLNIVLVGTISAVRRSLLRGGWQEMRSGAPETQLARTHHYRGRIPDGTFHKSRPGGRETKELRLWLSPVSYDGVPVWVGQASYEISNRLFWSSPDDYRIDPDLDEARFFLVQDFWYSQSLAKVAFALGMPPVSMDSPDKNFHGHEFFTDGLRAVLFLSEETVGMDEAEIIVWEEWYVTGER